MIREVCSCDRCGLEINLGIQFGATNEQSLYAAEISKNTEGIYTKIPILNTTILHFCNTTCVKAYLDEKLGRTKPIKRG